MWFKKKKQITREVWLTEGYQIREIPSECGNKVHFDISLRDGRLHEVVLTGDGVEKPIHIIPFTGEGWVHPLIDYLLYYHEPYNWLKLHQGEHEPPNIFNFGSSIKKRELI